MREQINLFRELSYQNGDPRGLRLVVGITSFYVQGCQWYVFNGFQTKNPNFG
jgi:hypothetical protein